MWPFKPKIERVEDTKEVLPTQFIIMGGKILGACQEVDLTATGHAKYYDWIKNIYPIKDLGYEYVPHAIVFRRGRKLEESK